MAVKRRIVWMADNEWAVLQGMAKDRGETVSGVIRWIVAAGKAAGDFQEQIAKVNAITMTADHSAQQERDAILKRINRGEK